MARPKTYKYLGPEKKTHTKKTKTISFKPAQKKQPKEKGCWIRDYEIAFSELSILELFRLAKCIVSPCMISRNQGC